MYIMARVELIPIKLELLKNLAKDDGTIFIPFLINIDVLMLCKKFELIPKNISSYELF